MVYMKNIIQDDNMVTFDGYINGKEDNKFTMTFDLNNSSNSTVSIEKNHYTSMALIKILDFYAKNNFLPKELVAMSH